MVKNIAERQNNICAYFYFFFFELLFIISSGEGKTWRSKDNFVESAFTFHFVYFWELQPESLGLLDKDLLPL